MNDLARYQSPAQAIPYADMEKMAAVIATSGLFGVKNPSQALALMLVAQAEGLHPATAARDYHVIQGRPALKADAMLARFQAAGGKVEWHEYTDKFCAATFSHPSGGKVRVDWTIEMARAAGLAAKDVWKQFPRPMLRSRVVSEGIRTVFPAVLCGMYTPEEVIDMREVDGPAETTGPAMPEYPSIDEIRKTLGGLNTVGDQLRYWQSLKIDNASLCFGEIKAAFTEARKALEKRPAPERVPLNPAPGKKATPESLAAAGYGDGDPAPFDDELEIL